MKKPEIPRVRFVIAGIIIFFILFIVIRLFVQESQSIFPLLIGKPAVFFALWIVIVLFTLTFLFILIRNIVKLYYKDEKNRGGQKIKRRLIFFFIAFSIIPTLLLFIFATDLIDRGINKWFSVDIDAIMENTQNLKSLYYRQAYEDLRYYARQITFDPDDGIAVKAMYKEENDIYLKNTNKKTMPKYRLDVVSVYLDKDHSKTSLNPNIPRQEYRDLSQDLIYKGLSGSDFQIPAQTLKNGELIRAGIHFDTPEGQRILVVVGRYYPDQYIKSLKELEEMVYRYDTLKQIKAPVKTTYILLFIFITILVIFSGSWIGLYLARGITRPISLLEAGSNEIIKGNLDVEIEYKAENEFGSLIQKFNAMARELKESRKTLSRKTNELRERRSMTETILNNITAGVLAMDKEGRIIDINPGAERMLGLQKAKLLDQNYNSITFGDSTADFHNLVKRAYETKFRKIEDELDIKIKGNILNLAVKITHIRDPLNKKFSGIVVVITDLTELIRAEKMMVWKEVARRIAHEIKNPLTPIQVSAQRIMKGFEESDRKFKHIVEDALGIINEELHSIKQLAEEFSNFARLPEMKFEKGDINQLLEKLISVYKSIYHDIHFKANLDADMPILVKMDAEQLKRVFVNIVDNSIRALNEKGTIEIKTKYLSKTEFIRIEIADDGPGISDDEKNKIFVPYFSKQASGTGLGLAISHSIIEEHNGQISCQDNKPKGVRFVIEIPA